MFFRAFEPPPAALAEFSRGAVRSPAVLACLHLRRFDLDLVDPPAPAGFHEDRGDVRRAPLKASIDYDARRPAVRATERNIGGMQFHMLAQIIGYRGEVLLELSKVRLCLGRWREQPVGLTELASIDVGKKLVNARQNDRPAVIEHRGDKRDQTAGKQQQRQAAVVKTAVAPPGSRNLRLALLPVVAHWLSKLSSDDSSAERS